ncbi:MAG: hypothetical protein QGG42_15620 [Phycisphaerae bacterium]|jgi:hypothetical protein|nr:hypothetical protein [Phycisphaerae bacterium]
MSEIATPRVPTWAQYEGEFTLTDKQVDSLVIHHANLTQVVFGWLDSEFRVTPESDSNWPMLGQHLIELLHVSDSRAFSGVCNQMANTMLQSVPPDNPFVAASLAEAGLTDNDVFKALLDELLKKQARHPWGLIPFATGFLNLGDQFSTLWALRLLILSGRDSEFTDAINKAIGALEQSFDLLSDNSDHVGFLLYDLSLLGRQDDESLVDRCLNHLLKTDTSWLKNTHDLRGGGFVAYDLLKVSGLRPKAMEKSEEWLAAAFNLTDEAPTQLPTAFANHGKQSDDGNEIPVDVWAQGWIRALVAATLYLRLRRSDYAPHSHILTRSVLAGNERAQLLRFYGNALPFLPSIQEMQEIGEPMKRFHDKKEGSPFEKSVFIMRSMIKSNRKSTPEYVETNENILKAVIEELDKAGLVGRHVGDRPVPYQKDLWANNEVYLRGCKYGIAIFERLERDKGRPFGPNHNVLIEFGFMRGKGASILILHDEATMHEKVEGTPIPPEGTDLPVVVTSTLHESFSSEEPELMQLRTAIAKWAKVMAKKEEDPSEAAKEKGDQESASAEDEGTED